MAKSSTTRAVPSSTAKSFLLSLCLAVAAAADSIVIIIGVLGQAPLLVLVAVHLSIAPLFWVVTRRVAEPTIGMIGLVSIVAMGPAGAIGTLFLAGVLDAARLRSTPDVEWYATLARAPARENNLSRKLWEEIADGRARELASATVPDFRQVMADGSIAEQQVVLGLIAKNFDPAHADVLREALKSEHAAVRVSAAAVFSKLQDNARKKLRSANSNAVQTQALERARALASGSMSRLLDDASADAARGEAIELLLSLRPTAGAADELEQLLCQLLMEDGRHAEVESRLSYLDPRELNKLQRLRAQAHMRTGNHREIPRALSQRSPNTIRLDTLRHAVGERALMAAPSDVKG